jgi:hypothetical protein
MSLQIEKRQFDPHSLILTTMLKKRSDTDDESYVLCPFGCCGTGGYSQGLVAKMLKQLSISAGYILGDVVYLNQFIPTGPDEKTICKKQQLITRLENKKQFASAQKIQQKLDDDIKNAQIAAQTIFEDFVINFYKGKQADGTPAIPYCVLAGNHEVGFHLWSVVLNILNKLDQQFSLSPKTVGYLLGGLTAVASRLGHDVAVTFEKGMALRHAFMQSGNDAQGVDLTNNDVSEQFFIRSPYSCELIKWPDGKVKAIVLMLDSNTLHKDTKQQAWLKKTIQYIDNKYSGVTHRFIMAHHMPNFTLAPRASVSEKHRHGASEFTTKNNIHQYYAKELLRAGVDLKRYCCFGAHEHTFSLWDKTDLVSKSSKTDTPTLDDNLPKNGSGVFGNGGANSNKGKTVMLTPNVVETHAGYGVPLITCEKNGDYNVCYYEAVPEKKPTKDKSTEIKATPTKLFSYTYNKDGKRIGHESFGDKSTKTLSIRIFEKEKPWVQHIAAALNQGNLFLLHLFFKTSLHYEPDQQADILTKKDIHHFLKAAPFKPTYTDKDWKNYQIHLETLINKYHYRIEDGKVVGPEYPNSIFFRQLTLLHKILARYRQQLAEKAESDSSGDDSTDEITVSLVPFSLANNEGMITYDSITDTLCETSANTVYQNNAHETERDTMKSYPFPLQQTPPPTDIANDPAFKKPKNEQIFAIGVNNLQGEQNSFKQALKTIIQRQLLQPSANQFKHKLALPMYQPTKYPKIMKGYLLLALMDVTPPENWADLLIAGLPSKLFKNVLIFNLENLFNEITDEKESEQYETIHSELLKRLKKEKNPKKNPYKVIFDNIHTVFSSPTLAEAIYAATEKTNVCRKTALITGILITLDKEIGCSTKTPSTLFKNQTRQNVATFLKELFSVVADDTIETRVEKTKFLKNIKRVTDRKEERHLLHNLVKHLFNNHNNQEIILKTITPKQVYKNLTKNVQPTKSSIKSPLLKY